MNKERNTVIDIVAMIVCLVGIAVLTIVFLSDGVRKEIISVSEILLGKELDYQYWNGFMSNWFSYVLLVVLLLTVVTLLSVKIRTTLICIISEFINQLKKNKDYILYFLAIGFCYNQFLNPFVTSDYIPGIIANYSFPFYWPSFNGSFFNRLFLHVICDNIYAVFFLLGLDIFRTKWFFQIMGVAVYAIIALIMEKDIKELISKETNIWIVRILILSCMVNPFMVETYVYCAFDFAIGQLFAVLSVHAAIKSRWILAALLSFVSVGFYETNMFISLILCILFIYLRDYSNLFMHRVKSMFLSCISVFSGAALYMILYKIEILLGGVTDKVKDPTLNGEQGILRWVKTTWRMIKGTSYMPQLTVLLILLITFLLVTLYMFKNKKLKEVLLWTLVFTGVLILPFAFKLISDYSEVARVLLPFFYMLGMLMLVAYCLIIQDKMYRLLLTMVICSFFCVSIYRTETYITDCFITRAIDQNIVEYVEKAIEEYEDKNDIMISTIVSRRLDNAREYYDENLILSAYSYAHPILLDSWAQGGYLNYVCGKDYSFRQMKEWEYEKYFYNIMEKDGYDLSKRLVFDNDTLYWLIY